jgi:DNA-binding XRE family transcriptional regulator
MNAQRNRGMYLRVERRAEIRKSRKISQAKLAKLLGVVEGAIQNYEHGRNEPNITRLYDAKRGRQPRVEYICRHSQQQIACPPVVPIGKQAQIRNVVVCRLSVGLCEYAFRSAPASGSPAPAAQAANFGLLDLQPTEAGRRPLKLPLQLGELPIEPAEERLSSLRVASIVALRRRSSLACANRSPRATPRATGVSRACNGVQDSTWNACNALA